MNDPTLEVESPKPLGTTTGDELPNEEEPNDPGHARRKRISLPGWGRPLGLALRGAFVALPFLVLHLIGAREATSILSGTSPGDGPMGANDAWLGAAYVIAWFAAILGGPVLLLAGALLAIWDRVAPPDRLAD